MPLQLHSYQLQGILVWLERVLRGHRVWIGNKDEHLSHQHGGMWGGVPKCRRSDANANVYGNWDHRCVRRVQRTRHKCVRMLQRTKTRRVRRVRRNRVVVRRIQSDTPPIAPYTRCRPNTETNTLCRTNTLCCANTGMHGDQLSRFALKLRGVLAALRNWDADMLLFHDVKRVVRRLVSLFSLP